MAKKKKTKKSPKASKARKAKSKPKRKAAKSLKSRVKKVKKKMAARKIAITQKLGTAKKEIKGGFIEAKAQVQQTFEDLGMTASRVQEKGIDPLLEEIEDTAADVLEEAKEIAASGVEEVGERLDSWRE